VRDTGQPAALEALRVRRSASVLHLEPLGNSEVATMIAACPLPQGFPADRVAAVIAAAEGIPLLVEEVLSVASEPTRDSTLSLPGTVAETVRQRMADVDSRTRDVLVCAALLGRRFDWRLLAPSTGLDESALQAALRQATALQLLETDAAGFRFRHALTRDAVLAAVMAPERSHLAMATRAAVEAAHPELPDQWCTIAADLAEAAGDHDGAARLLVVAGDRALRQAAFGTAEQLARRATGLSATPERAAASAELMAEVLAATGRVDEAAQIARAWLAMSRPEPAQGARMQLLLARAAVAGERWQLAREQLDGLAAAGIGANAAEHGALAAQVAIGNGRVEDAAALAGTALQAAELSGRPEVACEALEVIGRVERVRSLTAARAAFQRSAALADAHGLAFWYLRALHELGTVDMLENGQLDRLAYARERAAESGALAMVAVLDVQLAGGLWVRGECARSLAAGRRAAASGRRFRIDGIHRMGLCFAAIGYGPLVDSAGLEAGAAALAAVSDAPALTASIWGDGWTVYALLTEDRARALRSIERAAELGCAAEALPSPWWGLWPLLRALAGTDVDEAITAAHLVPSGWSEMMLSYTRAVVFGRKGRTAQAETEFARNDTTTAWPWWSHLGRRLVAEAALQDGWGEPIVWLREAALFFDGFPAPAVASACRSMMRRAGVQAPRAQGSHQVAPVLAGRGVTEREAEVLGLVGQGLSNAEVASRLFLSPRTVEKHVENLARKLGTGTRSQLVAYGGSVVRTT
jgi:DNA-binding CsgD family transcriptional regulator